MSDLQIPEPAAGFIDTVNAHDGQGFLDAFTTVGVVDGRGREFHGREAIKAWSDKEFIGAADVLTLEEVTVYGNDVPSLATGAPRTPTVDQRSPSSSTATD